MAKGYWIVRVDVADAEKYKAYIAANAAPLQAIRRPLPGARRQVLRPSKAAAAPATR